MSEKQIRAKAIGCSALWERYVEYKAPGLSEKTVINTFRPIGKLLKDAPQLLEKPLMLRSTLVTTRQPEAPP
jgi:hypothetical protein